MKKSTVAGIVIVIIVIVAIIIFGRSSSNSGTGTMTDANGNPVVASSTISAPVSETTKVSNKTSSYHNDELGFSVKYPTSWEKTETANGITFIMPIDSAQVSTIATLEADIAVTSGKCSFPPVTTIKDRGTVTLAGQTANMISMSNTVQGRTYFNRMYSLQKDNICYLFSFASIALGPESKKLTGSNATQATNNNKAITNTADADFTAMVKSFAFVTGPAGVDETKAPVK